MSEGTVPAELNQPLPRRTKPGLLLPIALAFPLTIYAVIVLAAVLTVSPRIRELESLRTHGAAARATITNLRVEPHHSYAIDYHFYVHASSGDLVYEDTDTTRQDLFKTLSVGESIPIVFDPSDPNKSAVNFGDSIHTANNSAILKTTLVAMFVPIALVYIFLLPILLMSYRKQRQLVRWGRTAPATIVDERESLFRGVKSRLIEYSFVDDAGHAVKGTRQGLPPRNAKWAQKYRTTGGNPWMFDNLWVLYDARNSSRHILYPSGLVTCIAPRQTTTFPISPTVAHP